MAVQATGDLPRADARGVFPEDAQDDFGLFRHHNAAPDIRYGIAIAETASGLAFGHPAPLASLRLLPKFSQHLLTNEAGDHDVHRRDLTHIDGEYFDAIES
nr:hypothetical protein [Albimonas donghaensis]